MRKICLLLTFLFLSHFSYAQDIPKPEGYVNDFANVLSDEYKLKLNSLIKELEEKTTSEIAVVTVDSISPYDEKEYARLLFDNWKPGKIGKDNGVLVLLAIKERRWRIETGYGIEGILPDGLCGEIGRNYMVPFFKEGSYGKGLYNGASAIANIIARDSKIQITGLKDWEERTTESVPTLGLIFLLTFGIFVVVLHLLFRKWVNNLPPSRRQAWGFGSHYGGDFGSGGFGTGGGGFGGFGGGGGGGGGAGGGF